MEYPMMQPDKTLHDNAQRILLLYNGQAFDLLGKSSNLHENIHQARLCFKRARSFLRLIKGGISNQDYMHLNVFYRDQSRALSQVRDITALIETAEILITSRRSENLKIFLRAFRNKINRQRREVVVNPELKITMNQVLDLLNQNEKYIREMVVSGELSEVIVAGIRRVYKRGKDLWEQCHQDPNDHNLHEWRKQVKYLWYQYIVIKPLWPGILEAWSRQLQILSQTIGKHHDLVLLETALTNIQPRNKNRDSVKALKKSIRRSKLKYENQAVRLGNKIFAAFPSHVEIQLKSLF